MDSYKNRYLEKTAPARLAEAKDYEEFFLGLEDKNELSKLQRPDDNKDG
jgi:hypothetical protein